MKITTSCNTWRLFMKNYPFLIKKKTPLHLVMKNSNLKYPLLWKTQFLELIETTAATVVDWRKKMSEVRGKV